MQCFFFVFRENSLMMHCRDSLKTHKCRSSIDLIAASTIKPLSSFCNLGIFIGRWNMCYVQEAMK